MSTDERRLRIDLNGSCTGRWTTATGQKPEHPADDATLAREFGFDAGWVECHAVRQPTSIHFPDHARVRPHSLPQQSSQAFCRAQKPHLFSASAAEEFCDEPRGLKVCRCTVTLSGRRHRRA